MPSGPGGRPKRGGRDESSDAPDQGSDATIIRPPKAPRGTARSGAPPTEPPDSSGHRLVDLAADWFSTILALRHVRELPEAEALRHRMLTLKKQFESAATEGGFNPEDIEASQLALIALLDETVFSGRGKGSEAWRRTPLTEVVYGHHLGGEEFYNHLEKLRAQPEAHAAALELFAFCLALGFKGRLAGTDELAQVRHQVLEQVARLRRGAAPPLAPNFEWHQDLPDIEKDWFRWWMPPVGAVIAMILTWAIVKFIAVAEAREIANEIVQRVGR